MIIGDNGLPEQADEIEYVGTAYADWKAGWYNEFSYKGFKLGILLDGQVGGTIYSMSFHKMMEQGKLTQSLNGRLPGTEYIWMPTTRALQPPATRPKAECT